MSLLYYFNIYYISINMMCYGLLPIVLLVPSPSPHHLFPHPQKVIFHTHVLSSHAAVPHI